VPASALADLVWPEVGGGLVAIPLGSTEQHGPHLPLSTDTLIAVALAVALAAERDGVVVAPPLPYGSSGEHGDFAGTLSIGQEATELVLVELCRSASATFSRTLLISAHGGNAEPLRRAVERLSYEGRDVHAWQPSWDGDAHAGRVETSILLALDAAGVRLESAEVGNPEPIERLMGPLRERGVRALSPNGILGDPTGASAAEGAELLAAALVDLVGHVDAWRDAAPVSVAGP
jgi:mycofactocin system creatininase family protein